MRKQGQLPVGPAVASPPLEPLLCERLPQLVEHARRVAVDLLTWPLEVLLPQPEPHLARERGVTHYDVALGVVEERVLVEVRRADRGPGVVDDRRLGMDVDRVAARPRLVERAGEEPRRVAPRLLVGVDQHPDLAAAVVTAVVRLRREHRDHAKVVARWTAQFLRKHEDQLGRPQELALEVHEPLGASQRAQVALEDRPFAFPQGLVHPLGHGAHELRLDSTLDGRRPAWLR